MLPGKQAATMPFPARPGFDIGTELFPSAEIKIDSLSRSNGLLNSVMIDRPLPLLPQRFQRRRDRRKFFGVETHRLWLLQAVAGEVADDEIIATDDAALPKLARGGY